MQNLSLLYLEMHINDKKICKAESWKVLIFWEKKNENLCSAKQGNWNNLHHQTQPLFSCDLLSTLSPCPDLRRLRI